VLRSHGRAHARVPSAIRDSGCLSTYAAMPHTIDAAPAIHSRRALTSTDRTHSTSRFSGPLLTSIYKSLKPLERCNQLPSCRGRVAPLLRFSPYKSILRTSRESSLSAMERSSNRLAITLLPLCCKRGVVRNEPSTKVLSATFVDIWSRSSSYRDGDSRWGVSKSTAARWINAGQSHP